MKLSQGFTGGKMNLDVDERLIKKGEYREAFNIRIANSEGSDVGAIEKSLSNKLLTSLNLGSNAITLGGTSDEFEEKIYWLVKSDLGCYIIEHDFANNITSFVLKDTRPYPNNVLQFDKEFLITSIRIIIDTDNDNRFLVYTDNNTQPKCINIERAKTFNENDFTEEMILVIKKPPLDAPEISLLESDSNENNIEEKFLRFAYRYKYIDGEYSALSPFSEVAFFPSLFNYDFSTGSNESMVNNYSKVNIKLNTGSKLVTDIDVIFVEDEKNIPYLIDSFNKNYKEWNNYEFYEIEFTNNKTHKNISESQLFRLFDNVPLKAKSLEVIDNRIVFGNYTENYNLLDNFGSKVNIDLELTYESIEIEENIPKSSIKSNRDIEVAIAYLDDYGRMTTPLISENNTTHIKHSDCVNQNVLSLSINNKPPYFARYYRIFIKQNKKSYDTIVPTVFYFDNGYIWVKIEKSDIDKVVEGEYLIAKSDTRSLVDKLTKTKILAVEQKEENFLGDEEESGTYFKIKPNEITISPDDMFTYYHKYYNDSSGWKDHDNPIRGLSKYYDSPIYYGSSDNSSNLKVAGTYIGNDDLRYLIRIEESQFSDELVYKWSKDNGVTYEADELEIITGPVDLDNGLTIEFENIEELIDGDYWIIVAKGLFNPDGNNFTWGFYNPNEDGINPNTRIWIRFDGHGDDNTQIDRNFTSSKGYANIEEWYYGDSIYETLSNDIEIDRVKFRRGTIGPAGNATYLQQNTTDNVVMCIKSKKEGSDLARVLAEFSMTYFENNVIFETEAKQEDSDIYYQIGRTYDVLNGLHRGWDENDIHQTSSAPATIKLPFFNCFSFGNGFESIKIKDQFNANEMALKVQPSVPVENYRRNTRVSSLTYSQRYDQTTNYNGLNEFNLSLINFKDLDDKYGSIQTILAHNTNLDVWQEDKVHKILYAKTTLYNEDGSSNITKSNQILGTVVPYAGEFGISNNAESLVSFGNYRYWCDSKRGVVLRKGKSGIEVISNYGMRDWFRDYFREHSNFKNLLCIDPYYNQLNLSLDQRYTITFDEKVRGFTSFHSFLPDWMLRLNNRFFSIKNGELWIHNEETNGYNNFYGVEYNSKVTTIFNDYPDIDKIFKTFIQQSNYPWQVEFKTNISFGNILSEEFSQRDSRWYTHFRKNENPTDFHSVTQGLGIIEDINNNIISVTEVSQNVSVNDNIYQLVNENPELIGIISNIQGNQIEVNNIQNQPLLNSFCFSKKDPRLEGSEIKGYYLEATLLDKTISKNELFAINIEVSKSFL